jgi:diaminopimelate decarboxylase
MATIGATKRDGEGFLTLGGVRLVDVARDPRIGTPAYVYDLDAIAAEARDLRAAFDDARHLVAYAVKANSAGPIVRALAREGCGADVVSGGEMLLAIGCGVAPDKIVFSGVGKTDDELDRAIGARIAAIQVESVEELDRIDHRARAAGAVARVALRINPGLDRTEIETHKHVATGHDEAKFGVPIDEAAKAIVKAMDCRNVELVGLASHVGSQLGTPEAYLSAARALFSIARIAIEQGAKLAFVDTGGGFGVDYGTGAVARPAAFVRATRAAQKVAGLESLELHVEPGRSLVATHGVLLASVVRDSNVLYLGFAERQGDGERWLVIDAGMNDLIRPALYQAKHRVVRLTGLAGTPEQWERFPPHHVVGPVCESADDFGQHPALALSKHVAILDAGAYGYTMASRYNGRPLPAEVFLRGGKVVGVSPRKPMEDWADERAALEPRD